MLADSSKGTFASCTHSVCVILACHNRRDKTLACLHSLARQRLRPQVTMHVLMVDDGSTDGTAAAVAVEFPEVEILHGNGLLYWNGAMRLGLASAMQAMHGYYVLLNDDTILNSDALEILLSAYDLLCERSYVRSIVVGTIRDPATGNVSYGGSRCGPWWIPHKLTRIIPAAAPVSCDTFNCNCVLIPHSVVEQVGNLDETFTHAMGDFDYGFRATRLECKLWVAPGFVGECEPNAGQTLWSDNALSVRERWKRLTGPKGLPPREWLVYTRRHSGPLWPLFWLNPYLKFWLRALREAFTSQQG